MRQKPLNKFRGPYLDYDIPLNLAPGKRKERKLFSDLQRKNLRLRNRKALKRLELKNNHFRKTKERYLRHLSFTPSSYPNQRQQNRLKEKLYGVYGFSEKSVLSLTENKELEKKGQKKLLPRTEDFPILSFLSTKEKENKLLYGKPIKKKENHERGSKETVEKNENGLPISLKRKRVSRVPFRVSYPSGVFKNIVERRLDSGKRTTPFKVNLLERKKVSFIYGNLAFKSLRRIAKSISGGRKGRQSFKRFHFSTQNLVYLLESRLDILLFKIHFFPTLLAARQAIRNGIVTVNYKTVTFPGYQLRSADLINCNHRPKNTQQIKERAVSNLVSKVAESEKNTPNISPSDEFLGKTLFFSFSKGSELFHFDMEKELFGFRFLFRKEKEKEKEKENDEKRNQKSKAKTETRTSFVSLKDKSGFSPLDNPEKEKKVGGFFKKLSNISKTGFPSQFFFFKTLHRRETYFLKKEKTQIERSQREISLLRTKRNPMKPLNVEVSYLSLSAIYLYPPQKVSFPAYIDLDTLFKSLS